VTTSYPGSLDSFTNPASTDTLSSSTVPHAAQHDNANDAIAAIETTLGTNPQGSYSTVAARLSALGTSGVTFSQWRFTSSGGETSLSGSDAFSTTLAYTAGAEMVFVNGVLLERGVDYTASNGTSVSLTNALVAGDIATVASPSSFSVANAIPLSTVTAKGDTIVATGSGSVTNLAVGADGSTLVANSSAGGGLSWAGQPYANPVLNSAMDIWQRGTSISVTSASVYGPDRYYVSSGAAATYSRQATGDTTNLPNIQYCTRVQRNSGQTGTNALRFSQAFESVNAISFAGKTVTFSFYARAGSNYSASSNALAVNMYAGTGTDQNLIATGYTGQTNPISQTTTLTTTWQRFAYTGIISSSATEIGFVFDFTPTGTAGTNDYYDITGIQIDLGSVALPYRRNASTLQGELAACQRYYYRITNANQTPLGTGFGFSTGGFFAVIPYPVTMRVAATAIDYNALSSIQWQGNAGGNTPSSVVLDSNVNSIYSAGIDVNKSSSFSTTGVYSLLLISGGYLGFSAEL